MQGLIDVGLPVTAVALFGLAVFPGYRWRWLTSVAAVALLAWRGLRPDQIDLFDPYPWVFGALVFMLAPLGLLFLNMAVAVVSRVIDVLDK